MSVTISVSCIKPFSELNIVQRFLPCRALHKGLTRFTLTDINERMRYWLSMEATVLASPRDTSQENVIPYLIITRTMTTANWERASSGGDR